MKKLPEELKQKLEDIQVWAKAMEKRNGEKPNENKENRFKSEKKIECVNCGLELDPEEVEEIDGEPYCSFCAEEIELDRDIEEEWIDL